MEIACLLREKVWHDWSLGFQIQLVPKYPFGLLGYINRLQNYCLHSQAVEGLLSTKILFVSCPLISPLFTAFLKFRQELICFGCFRAVLTRSVLKAILKKKVYLATVETSQTLQDQKS